MKIVILGAGPTGLGAAYQCNKLGCNSWTLYEREKHVGGLSASFLDDHGFTWDVGGHVLFSHYEYFDKVVRNALGDDYYEHLRECWIRILDTWVPYPFQNNIRYLPPDVMSECLDGLRHLNTKSYLANNFHEWIEQVFGKGIVKYFLKPYNEKVWGMPLDLMSRNWVGERVSVVDINRIERNIKEQKDDVSWGPNNKFLFPKYGGTGCIFASIARTFLHRTEFSHLLSRVSLSQKNVTFSNGKQVPYDILINTIPLDLFIRACDDAPESLRDSSRDLAHNSGLIVGIGLSAKGADSKCWMYFPETNAPFYRVTNFHNYSPFNVPQGGIDRYSSLMCETTYSEHKPVVKSTIVERTIEGLINAGMLRKDQKDAIVSQYLIDIPYSYPVPTINRDRALNVIQPYLESRGVYSRGRFGAWKYEVGNMDHSFMQGAEVVDRILFGRKERVVGEWN